MASTFTGNKIIMKKLLTHVGCISCCLFYLMVLERCLEKIGPFCDPNRSNDGPSLQRREGQSVLVSFTRDPTCGGLCCVTLRRESERLVYAGKNLFCDIIRAMGMYG